MRILQLSFAIALAAWILAAPAGAGTLYYNRTYFMADASGASAAINFDSYSSGTDLTGATISGATLTAPGQIPLIVIAAAAGVRYAPWYEATNLVNVLSPGGSDVGMQQDDLQVTFGSPVQSFGLDVVFDAPDGGTFVTASFYDPAHVLLGSTGAHIPGPIGWPGYQFVGYIAGSGESIGSVVFDEWDESAPDDHVGYDNLVFSAPSNAVPEPSGWFLMAGGLLAVWRARKR